MVLIGFRGSEVGNKYLWNVLILKKVLLFWNLEIVSVWFSIFLIIKLLEEMVMLFIEYCDFLYEMGVKVIVVFE